MFMAFQPGGEPVMVTRDVNHDRPHINMPSASLVSLGLRLSSKLVMVTCL